MITDGMFSSNTDQWNTPQVFFDELNSEFHFDIDVCANADSAKCAKYFSPEQDGLSQEWSGTCYCNPPYGRVIGNWVGKAYQSSQTGATIVMLLPARTDTRWFHDFIYGKAEIRFIRGRLKFSDHWNSAPFPSMIVIFRPIKGQSHDNP